MSSQVLALCRVILALWLSYFEWRNRKVADFGSGEKVFGPEGHSCLILFMLENISLLSGAVPCCGRFVKNRSRND